MSSAATCLFHLDKRCLVWAQLINESHGLDGSRLARWAATALWGRRTGRLSHGGLGIRVCSMYTGTASLEDLRAQV